MKFIVEGEIFEKYPGVTIGVIVAEKLDNSGSPGEIAELLKSACANAKNTLELESLSQEPRIQSWRRAYKLFGEDKDRASHEALIRRVLKGGEIPHINKLVDIYNLMSIKHVIPMGGEDLDKVQGDVRLKFSDGNESFLAIGSQVRSNPKKGEVIYADDKEVICSKWNWRESDNIKFTEKTSRALLAFEGLPPFTEEKMRSISSEFAGLIGKYCGGEIREQLITASNREMQI
ncbi:MAG: phenylalanine--tRNA ligase beta subunit-related protein [Candidatus Micrarchaeota archaeon]